ncbi:MAG: acyl-CoA dehydrogenase family protein [Pseudomonadota bacterium]
MDLQFTAKELEFRDEVRAFLAASVPADVARRSFVGMHPPNEQDRRWWNRTLNERGWSAPLWPKEHGGPGWSHVQSHIFEYECRVAGAPELRWQGLRLIGPVIYTFASAEQKARYLPGILSGDEMWAQGFSEPGAGSDLASLKTTAVIDGDDYIVNGQKLWTTEGHYSEMGFFLVRTSSGGKPQAGISMLVLKMDSPGVTVRQIPMINGEGSTCEVFLDNVRVPRANLIGEEGTGWNQAKFLLTNERTSSADIYKAFGDLARIRHIANNEIKDGRPLIEDRAFARRLAELEVDVNALNWSVLRVLFEAPSEYSIGACASVLKVRGSELQQRLTELAVDALGPRALRMYRRDEAFGPPSLDPLWPDYTPGVMTDLLYLRSCTIYGGAKEVQKNIIAKLAFGL